jgi:UDP-N-acetylglucosamine 1-carboxyvinyltransferase
MAAAGTSHVTGVELIKRGYEHFTDKLTGLGASFELDGE